jgi:hypothetical protein
MAHEAVEEPCQISLSKRAVTISPVQVCLLVTLALALSSCALPMNDSLGKQAYQTWVNQPTGNPAFLPPEGDPGTRDAFIFHLKAVKDFEYSNYVLNLRRGVGWGEVGADSVKIILDSLVAVTGAASTKAALGAASAGVTGATTSVKKNILFDQTITTFITKMDALRLNKWNDILCKMGHGASDDCKKPSAPYTIAEAFDDLQEYGRDGTLDAALRDVDQKAASDKAAATATNDKLSGGIQKLKPLKEGL